MKRKQLIIRIKVTGLQSLIRYGHFDYVYQREEMVGEVRTQKNKKFRYLFLLSMRRIP